MVSADPPADLEARLALMAKRYAARLDLRTGHPATAVRTLESLALEVAPHDEDLRHRAAAVDLAERAQAVGRERRELEAATSA